MARSRSSRRRRAASRQAQDEALVKFGPEGSALAEIMRQAGEDYSTGVQVAKGTAAGLQASAKAAIPQVNKVYTRASAAHTANTADLLGALNALGPAGARFAGAAQREATGRADRISESQAGAETELRQRGVDAAAGLTAQTGALAAALAGTREKVASRLQSMGQEQGAFQSAAVRDILEADRKTRVQLRGQTLAHTDRAASQAEKTRHDKQTEKTAAQKAAGKGKAKKSLTPDQQQKRIDAIGRAQSWIPKLEKMGFASPQIRQALQAGTYSVRVKETLASGKSRVTVKDKSIPGGPIGRDWTNAAYDLHVFGRLGKVNYKRLKARGIKIPKEWRPDNTPFVLNHPPENT
jgi:hypothetical protein